MLSYDPAIDPTTSGVTAGVAPKRRKRAGRLASGGPIRESAATLFLEKGYQGTTMDEIAAAAGVSKQTIYTHFASKEELFADLVLGNADRVDAFAVAIENTRVPAREDLEGALRLLARRYVRFVIRPEVLRLRRLVIGEAARFPDVARTYFETVPGRVYDALADLLDELRDEGRLTLDDPVLAAHQFAWLILGWPLDRGMFLDVESAIGDVDLDHVADEAVRVFLAAYAARHAIEGK